MFTGKLYIDKGGGTNRVILNRSKSLVERGYNVAILTTQEFDTNQAEKNLKKVGRLDNKVTHLNIYDYYKELNTKGRITDIQNDYYNDSVKLNESNYQIETDDSNTFARYFKNDMYIKYKQWRKNGTLNYIEYYNNDTPQIVREKYHKKGYINKMEFFDREHKFKVHYFTSDGYCFLEILYGEENEKTKHFLYNRDSLGIKSFNGPDEFYSNWLNHICSSHEIKPYLICDKITFASSVINMKNDIAYRIFAIHSNHLKSPFTLGSPEKSQHKKVLDHISELDSVVILTNKQKVDIIEEYGDYDNTFVIPHSVPHIPSIEAEKRSRTISMVARLAPVKQISHSIIAFQRVIQKVPNARLEIYGLGKQEKKLRTKIEELHLENNVFLKGYSQDTDEIYQSSLVTLLTSKSEAFALVVLESMINGTPVISYDINYGPSDIIKNKKDGYLIEQDNNVLADKMIELLKKPRKAHKMGKRARKNTRRKFDDKIITNKWIELFNYLKTNN